MISTQASRSTKKKKGQAVRENPLHVRRGRLPSLPSLDIEFIQFIEPEPKMFLPGYYVLQLARKAFRIVTYM